MKEKTLNDEKEKALVFVRHIEHHLRKEGIDGKVICKICGKNIDEINDLEHCFLEDEK